MKLEDVTDYNMHEQSLGVVAVLECVVRRCFGPGGGSVLFTRDTGETVISRHGQRVLSTLHLEHPMARMVLDCVSAHAQVTADGSKSFIFLLAALLRGIRDSTHTHRTASCNASKLQNLASRLLALSYKELDDVITHNIIPYASLYCSRHSYKADSSALDLLVGGYVAGRLGIGQADILKRILCEFYHKVSQNQDAVATINFLHSHFSLLHTPVSGLPIGCSEVIEGLVVTRDWSVWTELEESVTALVIYESLGSQFIAESDNISLSVQRDWLLCSDGVLKQKLAGLLHLQVRVVLSSVKQPEGVLQWARLNRVALLECVDSAQLDMLCHISSAESVSHPPLHHLVRLKFCSRVQLGGLRYACLGPSPNDVLQTHTLILCAPAAGLLDQTVCVCQGVFTMLQHLCESITSTHIPLNKHLEKTQNMCQTRENTNEAFQSSVPVPGQSQRSTSVQSQSLLSSQDLWGGVMRAGGVLPVGGMFEFLLHHFLLNNQNHGDSESCRLLAEALLCVPRSLYSHSRRRFLEVQTHFLSDLKQEITGQDSAAGSATGPDLQFGFRVTRGLKMPVCFESVSGKQQLLVSVLQCLNRLLRVGVILHSRSPLFTRPPALSEDDDDGGRNEIKLCSSDRYGSHTACSHTVS